MKNEQPDWLKIVREKVETLRFGVVQIVIHDSQVTQIERTEKTRIFSPAPEISNRPDKLEATIPTRAVCRTTGNRS
ncbi:MAG TPA: YezD family protein [Chthoniobacterales bacterium]|jgi:hypothetical protein|nr:YezD family protein [Chthoniobacterales bacterium]